MMFLILSFIFNLQAETRVKSLRDSSSVEINKLLNEKKMALIFQKDCMACESQIKDLKCFDSKDIVLLGVNSSEKVLRQEVRSFRVPYSAYKADEEALKAMNITVDATPLIILLKQGHGSLYRGTRPCEEYKQLYNKKGTSRG